MSVRSGVRRLLFNPAARASVRTNVPAMATATRFAHIGAKIDAQFEAHRHTTIFKSLGQNIRWTYEELERFIEAFGSGLHELGFAQKMTLAVDLPTSAELVVAQLGAAKAGVTLVPVDLSGDINAVANALAVNNCRGILFGDDFAAVESLVPELASAVSGRTLRSRNFPHLQYAITTSNKHRDGYTLYREMMVYDPVPNPMKTITLPESGVPFSTDGDKTVSQDDILSKANNFTSKLTGKLSRSDRVLIAGDVSFNEVVSGAVAGLANNVEVVISRQPLDDEIVSEGRPSIVIGDTQSVQFLSSKSKSECEGLRLIVTDGSVPSNVGDAAQNAVGVSVTSI